jgi:hypothetical protein
MELIIEAPSTAAVSLLPESARRLLPVEIKSGQVTLSEEVPSRRLEITWSRPAPGRDALPLRPPESLGFDILEACRGEMDRPIPWCIIGWATRENAHLMDWLTTAWGAGVACLSRKRLDDSDHGLSHAEATLVQSRSQVRAWWGEAAYLDPFLVLESLRHGCLPLQCVPETVHGGLIESLPPGLHGFTLGIPAAGYLPPLTLEDWRRRLDAGLSVVLAGTLERDLNRLVSAAKDGRT